MTYIDICKAQLRIDEGWKNRPYKDTVGKLTVGCGRNIDDVPFGDDEITLMLENDLIRAESICRTLYPGFDAISDNRRAALMNLAFNMGGGLSAFHHMNEAVNNDDWEEAARQLMASKWATQVQESRSSRLHDMIQNG